jgi:5,10-methylenetetrahydromethanopterin reductase
VSSRAIVEQWNGLPFVRGLAQMREAVQVIRGVLSGERVNFEGQFYKIRNCRLAIPPPPKPVRIVLAALGDDMLRMAGEIADGVLLNYLVGPRYNQAALEHLAAGAARAGRSVQDLDRPQLVVCSLDEDRDLALDRARELVTQYLGQQPHIGKASGVDQSLLDDIGRVLTWPASEEEIRRAMKLVPDEVVQMITASGTPDECRAKVREYVEAGCTCPILYPLGDDVFAMIDAFAEGKF